jgi:hypothetical protein
MYGANEVFIEAVFRERHARLCAEASTRAMLRALRPSRRPLRAVVGRGLIRVGQWLSRPEPAAAGRRLA